LKITVLKMNFINNEQLLGSLVKLHISKLVLDVVPTNSSLQVLHYNLMPCGVDALIIPSIITHNNIDPTAK
jgi:hypothetical protein